MTAHKFWQFGITAVALALMLVQASFAEEFPGRPIKIVVGAPAGGTTDTMARAIADPMTAVLKQPVLVENRPGAGGNLAAAAVAKSASDGYTLLVSFSSHTINATLYPSLPYDPVTDFTPITMIARVPSLLVGRVDLRAKDLKELITLARAQPHKLTIGIGGIGSSLHLAGEKFKLMTDVDLLNIPYKGTAPALTDLLGGQIDLMFISLVTGAEQVRAGKLRAYGVTSDKRQAMFPDLPAISEVVPGFDSTAWFGVFGPANLPDAITQKLYKTIIAALAGPKLREQLQTEGATSVGNTPKEFKAFVREDIERWAPVVKASGAKPN
jgi:tripartite-type tricarboxylate transporter receptor subunit TctC